MPKLWVSLLLLLTPLTSSALSVNSAKLSDTADANGYYTIDIIGSGFGLGPNMVLFDDFNNQVTGQDVALNKALVGKWISSTSYPGKPKIVDYGKGKAFQIHDFTKGAIAQIETEFTPKVSSIFISYSVVVPEGRFFAGSSSDLTFPSMSSWKFTWITDTAMGITSQTKFNVCTPSHAGKGAFILAGNSVNFGWPSVGSAWSWHTKNYISFGIQPDAAQPQTSPGALYFQLSGKKNAPTVYSKTNTAIYPLTNTTSFDRAKFPGWFGNGDQSNFDAYYDDIYVATGDNVFARVEISDAATFDKSRLNLALPVMSWNNTSIQLKIHREHLQSGSDLFVRVHDAANSSVAIALPCQKCPVMDPP